MITMPIDKNEAKGSMNSKISADTAASMTNKVLISL
jgi:hypothetical protein